MVVHETDDQSADSRGPTRPGRAAAVAAYVLFCLAVLLTQSAVPLCYRADPFSDKALIGILCYLGSWVFAGLATVCGICATVQSRVRRGLIVTVLSLGLIGASICLLYVFPSAEHRGAPGGF